MNARGLGVDGSGVDSCRIFRRARVLPPEKLRHPQETVAATRDLQAIDLELRVGAINAGISGAETSVYELFEGVVDELRLSRPSM